ncbi:MAG: lipopolysaccharide heptosyltransferase II [Candidatus Omnitrophota bacterium]
MDLSKVKKILVIRLDRIGDVLLSTPVLSNLRREFRQAYIAVMVSPYSKDIVEGNPNINEVIIYDKKGREKSWFSTIRFALDLKKKNFDLAIILHPTNRSHLIPFLAGIKMRVGYDRKLSFLLTKKIPHSKQLGQMHERDYCLDMLSQLGLKTESQMPFMPIKEESEIWADRILASFNVDLKKDNIVAMHPGASCPSKRWPTEYFATLAKSLIKDRKVKIAVVAASDNEQFARQLVGSLDSESVIDLVEKTNISELASILKRSSLFISNDSGPVHIASAVGVPVISIFGRNQAGLSPLRWGPLGKKDKIMHKDVGCDVCLAHDCKKDFLCLRSINPQEVIELAKSLL